jgi:hypothetical protein
MDKLLVLPLKVRPVVIGVYDKRVPGFEHPVPTSLGLWIRPVTDTVQQLERQLQMFNIEHVVHFSTERKRCETGLGSNVPRKK